MDNHNRTLYSRFICNRVRQLYVYTSYPYTPLQCIWNNISLSQQPATERQAHMDRHTENNNRKVYAYCTMELFHGQYQRTLHLITDISFPFNHIKTLSSWTLYRIRNPPLWTFYHSPEARCVISGIMFRNWSDHNCK